VARGDPGRRGRNAAAPGARAATFTVAGAVRRGLAAAGFQVDKRPGFGRKKERLEAREARRGDGALGRRVRDRLAVIGGGIAGAAMARARARAEGRLEVTVFDDGEDAGFGQPRRPGHSGPGRRRRPARRPAGPSLRPRRRRSMPTPCPKR
jgi:hypothetical protein